MKSRIIVAVAIIVLISSMAVCSILFAKSTNIQIGELIQSAQELAQNDNFEGAAMAAEKANDEWINREKWLSIVIRHVKLDEISMLLSGLSELAKNEDKGAFLSDCKKVKRGLTHLWETERPKLTNLF